MFHGEISKKSLVSLFLQGNTSLRHLVLMSLMDGLREDDEVIDAEYREVEPEEAESEIDDYAIPDEPESYASNRDYVSAKGMTPQETADEDRMVTQAEYGAEIEAETSEKDPSELQYITPIDYAKRIAELDEDLRDAAEILVTDCSCYTPFRAFLMDVVQSDFAFMPNKLDLIRDIALGTDNAERKAYSTISMVLWSTQSEADM